jgi:lipoate-protein ligase A
VEALTCCRLLPWEVADGPGNMAADDALVRTAAETGQASLRFYGWSVPTLSLGYLQPAVVRLADSRLAQLPFVRRPSGGAALVHHREVTYALAVPPQWARPHGEPWMQRMHRIIARALTELGMPARIDAVPDGALLRHGDVLCFEQLTPGDLVLAGHKIVGSAQRKYRRALMQHGAILLAQSEHTTSLPGIRELAGVALTVEQVREAVAAEFARQLGCPLEPGPWQHRERAETAELAGDQYAAAAWNLRR